jgi:hypothetical protein
MRLRFNLSLLSSSNNKVIQTKSSNESYLACKVKQGRQKHVKLGSRVFNY